MLRASSTLLTIVIVCLLSIQTSAQVATFKTATFRLSLDAKGNISEMTDTKSQKNYLATGEPAPLLSIRVKGVIEHPSVMKWNAATKSALLRFPKHGVDAVVSVHEKNDYITFELKRIDKNKSIELVIWGPFPTTIDETIGETVGVVRNGKFGIGIQALNIRTLGGFPLAENDIEPSYDIFQTSSLVDISDAEMNRQSYRGDVAAPKGFGSVLQAYCRNRINDRVIANWDHDAYYVPAFKDSGIIGTRIAMFGAATEKLLDVIGQIEVQEKLPHPLLNGVWAKQSRQATSSYLITNFGESTIDEAVELTAKAGLNYLYHGDPFETWGHFNMRKNDFPENWKSFRKCVEVAKKKNVHLGVHTLSNFITTNDAYVTPVPDKRLGKVGTAILTSDITTDDTVIHISSPLFFNQMKNNSLRSVIIGNEIIRYGSVSNTPPWKLENCTRGAFGTSKSIHKKNDTIAKLMDHGYKVFLTSYALQEEIAKTIARLCNEAGIRQISFDGLEGCWSSGMGQYARQLFVKTWYDHLGPELQGQVINDASNPGHYFWHIYTRMNWGEPWYAGFRESQVQYRLKNQEYFRRNLMPSMLGWFNLTEETTLEDIEWLLARAAGFDAGFGLSANIQSLKKHGKKDLILQQIKWWETVRMNGDFSEEHKRRMRDIKQEFHLESFDDKNWLLTPLYSARFTHAQKIRQPGEPVHSVFAFDNKGEKQGLIFTLSILAKKGTETEGKFENISFEVNNNQRLELPVSMTVGQILQSDGKIVRLYDRQWNLLQTVTLSSSIPMIEAGDNKIIFDTRYTGENAPDVKIEISTKGIPEMISKK